MAAILYRRRWVEDIILDIEVNLILYKDAGFEIPILETRQGSSFRQNMIHNWDKNVLIIHANNRLSDIQNQDLMLCMLFFGLSFHRLVSNAKAINHI